MLNGRFRTALHACATFGAVFDAGCCGFAFDKFVHIYWADVFAALAWCLGFYAFSVSVALVVVYFDYYVSGFVFFYYHFWYLTFFYWE